MTQETNSIQCYEQQITELERIVAAMESGTLSLEQSLAEYEQGIKLIRQCQASLQQAEQKVQILNTDTDGTEYLATFDPEQS